MPEKNLEGKAVWVTGSAKRVGRVIALDLARHGADIVVHCRSSRKEADETAKEIEALGRRALVAQGDHGKRSDVERMVGEIGEAFDSLHALVNSAAAFPRIPFEKTTDEEWNSVMDSNLRGPWLCSQCALPLLRKGASSHIVNLVDCMKDRPYANHAAYWCAKGGLDVLTRALAVELAPDIRVNSVSPGPVLAPPDQDEKTHNAILKKIALGEWGTPEDVAHAVRSLLTSEFLTGVDIPVDGGTRLQ